MALITLEEAADRVNTALGTLEDWVERGLLSLQVKSESPRPSPGTVGSLTVSPRWVDEDAVTELAESLGWMRLSAENWDESEDA